MIQLETVTLPDDLLWLNEYQWTPVAQQVSIMADGAVVVQADAQQTGRPITLTGGDDFGWIRRDQLETLRGMAAQAGQVYTLTLHDGSTRSVMFTGDRLRAEPVYQHSDPDTDHPYSVTLYLMETQ